MIRNVLGASALFLSLCTPALAERWDACRPAEVYPARHWKLEDPARYGWDAAKLLDAKSKFEMLQSASVVVIYKGHMIAEWGASAENFTAQSVRKGLINSLVGVLVDKGALSLDDTLAKLGIDDIYPPLTAEEKTATLRDLLHSRSGVFHSALYEVGGWKRMRAKLEKEKLAAAAGKYAPGAYWVYNNWDFNALGTIVEKASGMEIGDFFDKKIASPVGMQDFRPANVEYTTKDDMTEERFGNVSEHRAYMFDISTRDLARYGLMYLACGKWRSHQVVSREWVLESLDGVDTKKGRGADEQRTGFGDYGFLWQIDRPGSRRYQGLKTSEPVYFATGNRGHVLAVFPYLDLIIAHQVGTRGGVGAAAQIKRAKEGSPSVSDDEVIGLFKAIIAAHPDAATAYAAE